MTDVIRTSNEHSPECKSDTLKKRRATMPELQDHVREAAPDLLRELRDIVGRYERALTEAGWSDSRVKLATFSAREAIAKAGDDVLKAPAVETGAVPCSDPGWEVRDGKSVCKGCGKSADEVFGRSEKAGERHS